jgi:hypothetical protein
MEEDRVLADDIAAVRQLMKDGTILKAVEKTVGELK